MLVNVLNVIAAAGKRALTHVAGTSAGKSALIALGVAAIVALGSIEFRNAPANATASEQQPEADADNPLLGRTNRYKSLPKMNTPQQTVNDALEGTLEVAGKVIGRGIDEGGRIYKSGTDPSLNLLWAAEKGDVAEMQRCIDSGANVNLVDPHQNGRLETPLMCAARSGSIEAVRLLLPRVSRECKEARNNGGATALTIAIAGRNLADQVETGKRYKAIEDELRRAGVPR